MDSIWVLVSSMSFRKIFRNLSNEARNYRHNLIERGEKMADENRGRVTELVEKPQTMAKDTVKKAGETFDKYSEEVLTRIHVPTTDQIDTMNKKVASVDKKLDKVIKEAAAAERI
jgi:polyhydroxyalkanoate synthesis regulator phasin